jgi:outer membrane immunogenic protein
MKRHLFAAALLLATTSLASAADLSVPRYMPPAAAAVFDWTGFHIGANGGYGWANTDINVGTVPGIGPVPPLGSKLNGGFAGGQLGYDWQMSGWVLGVEADAQWADIGRTDVVTAPGSVFSLEQRLETFGTFRGRVGYAFNNVLVYGTGGWAWANEVGNASATVPGFAAAAKISNFLSGYAAGAGLEWAFLPNASAKIEYLHLGFDTNSYLGVLPAKTDVDTVRVGVTYRFH